MSKKTVINIENLNVSSLPASFYQGTYVNRGPSEMFNEEDGQLPRTKVRGLERVTT